jgi:hypothetical protein
MISLPLWQSCSLCAYAKECLDPFSAFGECVHPDDARLGSPLIIEYEFDDLDGYNDYLENDLFIASAYEKGRRGLSIRNSHFLYLREIAKKDRRWPYSALQLLIRDILVQELAILTDDFSFYYELNRLEVYNAASEALVWSVWAASPQVMGTFCGDTITWHDHLMRVTKLGTWHSLVNKFFPTDEMDDGAFRVFFEKEWTILVECARDLEYGFRVIPGLSYAAMLRYQNFPQGNPEIRQMVSSYLAHQGKDRKNLVSHFPPIRRKAIDERLKLLYKPLLKKTARRAMRFLMAAELDGSRQESHSQEIRRQLFDTILQNVEDEYDQAWEKFIFFVPYSGTTSPLGENGILGLAESPAERNQFDRFLKAGGAELLGLATGEGRSPVRAIDLTPILFSRYLKQHLKYWILKNYPPPKRRFTEASVPDDELFQANDSSDCPPFLIDEPPAVVGQDGRQFRTIEQAERRYGITARQLRYLDKIGRLVPLRADAVPGVVFVGGGAVPSGLRLYPVSDDMDVSAKLAIARTDARAGNLVGDELTRKAAASLLNVPVDTLRALERSGSLRPEKRGRTVVYSRHLIDQVRTILAERYTA